MEIENYWIIEDESEISTSVTLNFLSDQARLLSKMTNKTVRAVFSQRRIRNSPQQALASVLEQSTRMAMGITSKDASELYEGGWYEYYITDINNEYELAIFEIKCNQKYPIKLVVEEDIAYEADLSGSSFEINSHEEFLRYYKRIIQTSKVQYVIRRLIEVVNNQQNKDKNTSYDELPTHCEADEPSGREENE